MNQFDDIIKEAAQRTGLPESYIRAVIGQESSFNPNAVGTSGELGLMQVMPSTGQEWYDKGKQKGIYSDPFNLKDPKQNVNIGADYLSFLVNKYQDPRLAAIAYNQGPGATDKNVERAKQDPYGYAKGIQQRGGFDQLKDFAVDKAKNYAMDKAYNSIFGGGSSAAANMTTNGAFQAADGAIYAADGTYLGVNASTPMASSVNGGTILADGSTIGGNAGGVTLGNVAGAVGVPLSIYQGYQAVKAKDPMAAGISGAGLGMSLNALGLSLGPIGWAGVVAAPALMALANKWSDKDRWKEEQDAVGKLAKKGVTGWDEYSKMQPKLTAGRTKEQLVALEKAKAAAGQYSNETFAQSRNEKDLKGKDIWGYSDWGEKFGNDWFGKFSEQQREDISQMALDADAVDESKAGIKVNWSDDLQKKIDSYLSSGVTANAGQIKNVDPNMQIPYGSFQTPQKSSAQLHAEKVAAIKTDLSNIMSYSPDDANSAVTQYATGQNQAGNLTSNEAAGIAYNFPQYQKKAKPFSIQGLQA